MLILTRKAGEGIVVDGDVTIRVVSVQSNRVRIGIEAPSWMGIERGDSCTERETKPTRVEESSSGGETGSPLG